MEGPVSDRAARAWAVAAVCVAALGCSSPEPGPVVLTFPGSAVGAEAVVLERQLARFMRQHPDVRVVQQRTPDAADQRHQLYVQWLNAWADDPDVLQLDVIWTAEFAAAGWLLPLDGFSPQTADLFPATLRANTWRGTLYALPWFVDVGMLYWRSDLLSAPPARFEELQRLAADALLHGRAEYGWVFQGARYEGLVTVFSEVLSAFGGEILDASGRVVVDSPEGRAALQALVDAVAPGGIAPRQVLTWQEEPVRFAFQNGRALFMRNWPYAYPLLQGRDSRVAGRVGVAALPPSPGGRSAAALGGSQLAINARSDHPRAAWKLIAFLTHPDQLRERALEVGQYPPRPSLYTRTALGDALAIPPEEARTIVEQAVVRPVTPVYSQLSGLLQIQLHRALSGQAPAAQALRRAAVQMREVLGRAALAPERADG